MMKMMQPPPINRSPLSPPTPSPKPQHLLAHPAGHLSFPPGDGVADTIASSDEALLSLLRRRKTDEAYEAYACLTHVPSPTCLSRLVAQLSHQRHPSSLARAQSLVRRLRDAGELRRLDADSLSLLVASAARLNRLPYALALLRSMLRSGLLPHRKAWSSVVARLASDPDGGPESALRLFDSVLRRVRDIQPSSLAKDCRPDTAAFNAALNAAANLGDVNRFAHLFHGMPEFQCQPDILTYNILIKIVARANQKSLLVSALETILRRGLVPCITTFHSLVAAYVGFGDLRTAERLVQSMRDRRLDICAVLNESNDNKILIEGEEEGRIMLEKILCSNSSDPPFLPKPYPPDCRIYTTLMKGYLKESRVEDVVMMVRAMKREADPASRPDEVTYTTVVSALVKVGDVDRARDILDEMERDGIPANRITYNVLLKGHCEQLQLDKAKELIIEMEEKGGIEPDVVSYNVLIDGCILVDDSAGALAYFNKMRERGIPPSKVSYTTLMKAFALSGQPRLAHKVFDEMGNDLRVKVDRVAWNMLVEGYCRLGLIEEAKRVVERMKESRFLPDVATYGSLANGIAMARKPGEALLLWKEVKERCEGKSLKPDEGLLDALADVCVRAAFFKKALEVVACMEDNGIPPNKTKYKRIYVEMHSRMFSSKHASRARQERRSERKRAAEAFKFWLGLPNSYYGSEWRLEPVDGDGGNYEGT